MAMQPDDLSRLFLQRANAGDVDGVVALYEPDATLALPSGSVASGTVAIRTFYRRLLAGRPVLAAGDQQPPLLRGDLALTSARIQGGATAEVAQRQQDGSWLWAIDQPNVLA